MKYLYNGENIVNLPNVISFYRLLAVPMILVFVITHNERLFAVFLCISLVSDIADGNIARYFNLRTRFGAALDNVADMGTYAMALTGIFVFKWPEVQSHALLLYVFLAIFIISYFIAFARFGKVPGMHLYGAVIAGYIQGIFFFVLFAWDFVIWLYYLSIIAGIIAYTEKCIVLFRINEIRPGLKGLYWVIRDAKQNHS